MKRLLQSLALAIVVALPPGYAKDHPVANAAEFDAALTVVRPGDTLVLQAGTWRDVTLRFRAQGAPDRPVTLRAERPGETVFEGASQLVMDGAQLVVSGLKFQRNAHVKQVVTPYAVTVGSVITFAKASRDCRLTETAIVDSDVDVTTYVHLEPGSRDCRVDHCFFSNQGNIGVTFYVEVHPTEPNHHLIEHNYFGDRLPGTGNRWETIRIGHSDQQDFVSDTTVAHNYFYRCNGENECVSNKSTGNKFLYNAFIENRGELTLRHGNRAHVEGNYFFAGGDPAAEGVRVIGSDHVVINNYFRGARHGVVVYSGEVNPEAKGYRPVERALIAGNTFDDCAATFVLGSSGRKVPPRQVRIENNLVRARRGPIIQQVSGAGVSYAGNIMFGAELGVEATSGIAGTAPTLRTDPTGRIFADGAGVTERTPGYPRSREDVGPAWPVRSAR